MQGLKRRVHTRGWLITAAAITFAAAAISIGLPLLWVAAPPALVVLGGGLAVGLWGLLRYWTGRPPVVPPRTIGPQAAPATDEACAAIEEVERMLRQAAHGY